jgi:acyl-coenzyme A synthetase/AMP-(fatty) acid ligase/acyl carrier protein
MSVSASGPHTAWSAQRALRDGCYHPAGGFVEFAENALAQTVCERFAAIVSMHGDRLALRTRTHSFTFDELERASSRVAHALDSAGVGRGPVGLVFDNGAPFVVGSLGAIKAGIPQLALERAFPRARLEYVLQQSHATAILTDSRHARFAADLSSLPVINVDEVPQTCAATRPLATLDPDTPVVIDYTSGSTGHPKGVTWTHRGLMHVTRRHTNVSHIGSCDGLVMFRASVRAYLSVLLNGARFYPVDLPEYGFEGLQDWMAREDITIYRSAVSQFRGLASVLSGARFPRLRLVLLYGEPVHQTELDACKDHFPANCLLGASLGCNEIDDYAYYFADHRTVIGRGALPGGYPVDDVDVLFIDPSGRRVPSGETGEIAVRTRHPHFGYWRQPDRTRAAFIPDPDGSLALVYRTGDLGQIDADGCVRHLGRTDDQVKIRGYRVDVGEIESALLTLPDVKEAVVVGRGDVASHSDQLVAYIVTFGSRTPAVSELRRAVEGRVPAFAVPSVFVPIAAMPLTATGKVDRRRLPAPDRTMPRLDTPFEKPRTPVEETLTAIWAEVLDVERVGIFDRFLELGGDSLRAMRIMARIESAFNVRPPVQALLESPTVAQMAAVVIRHQAAALEAGDLDDLLNRIDTLSEDDARELLGDG